MPQPEVTDLLIRIKNEDPDSLAKEYIQNDSLPVFNSESAIYRKFRDLIQLHFPQSIVSYVVGSGNWGKSLNPNKRFSNFSIVSDVDVAIISVDDFHRTWNIMREHNIRLYYSMSADDKESMKRNAENVYTGFITPKWVHIPGNQYFSDYKIKLNYLKGSLVGYREVNALFFKSHVEMNDYYKRGFVIAKQTLRKYA